MKEIKAIVLPIMADRVIDALRELPHLPGIVVSTVNVFSRCDCEPAHADRAEEGKAIQIEVVVPDHLVEEIVGIIARAAHTGRCGDGKIFVYQVADVIKIQTGQRGETAI